MILKKASNILRIFSEDVSQLLRRQIDFIQARPRSALLFLTFRCISRCRSCSMWRREIPSIKELDLNGWKRVADELLINNVKVVELFGGDVFLRKDILIPFIRYLKNLNITIHMPTNALLLDEEIAYSLVQTGIDYIYISVDETGDEHDKVRGVKDNFKHVINAIKSLKKAKGNGLIPRLICNTTISNLNVNSINNIVNFTYEAGFDTCALEYVGEITEEHIKRSRVNGVYPDPYFIKQRDSLLIDYQQAIQLKILIKNLVKAYSKTKLDIYTLNIDTLSIKNLCEGTVPIKKCYQERTEVTVDPYGNVIVCPFYSKYILGNICEEPLNVVWNNSKHLEFRKYQNSGKLEICRHCSMAVERSYGLRKGFERIYYRRLREKLL